MTGRNTCAMSKDCEGKEADRGLMCADHRAESTEIARRFSTDECTCASCQSDPGRAGIVPCLKDEA